ncbi:hypothetical protein KSP40_PGU000514 [Platanthera guangdongensis]|uniref:Transcription termination factor MTERF8, chloroplastic n=1 Tax=Platanthera guangdongensis TaxID=2320717 RepID=A0ABR2MIW3_9ASPA
MVSTPLSSPFTPVSNRIIPSPPSSSSPQVLTHATLSRLPSSALSLVGGLRSVLQPFPFLPLQRHNRIDRTNTASILSHFGSVLLLTELGIDQNEAEFLLHNNQAVTSSESLRLRIGTLQSVGLTNFFLRQAIAKRPDILTSLETGSFLNFINEEAVELLPKKLERLLVSTHPASFPGLLIKIRLLLCYGFPQKKLGHLLNVVDINRAFTNRTIDVIKKMILFLQRYGWPDIIVRRPKLLNLEFYDQLLPRVQFFTDLAGGDEESSSILIQKMPAILAYTVDHLESHLEFWKSVGLTEEQVFKIALVYPNIFSVSRERKLTSRIEFLDQCQLDAEAIFKFLIKAPLFVSLSYEENLAKKLSFLVKLGYRYRTREMAFAIGATTRTSTKNMQKVLGLFFCHGFSGEDVLSMSKKHPQVLQYSCESLEKKMEFLIHEMDREVGELLNFPAFLGYKLDGRIKYRYEKKIANRRKGLSINKLLSMSDERFSSKSKKMDRV